MPAAAAFATPEELAVRLGRAVWAAGSVELAQVQTLLADATAHLREIIGWQVSPPVAVTTVIRGSGTHLPLHGKPVTAITAVTADGVTLASSSYELEDGSLRWRSGGRSEVTVTYTVGYSAPPPDLVSWTCVLASQALSAVGELGALGAGGVSSIAIDDFRKSWADGGDGAGFVLPARVEEKLRERYGAGGAFVSGER